MGRRRRAHPVPHRAAEVHEVDRPMGVDWRDRNLKFHEYKRRRRPRTSRRFSTTSRPAGTRSSGDSELEPRAGLKDQPDTRLASRWQARVTWDREMFLIVDLKDRMNRMRNMPAASPYTSPEQQADLERLGARLRERRKALGVTVVACAEAAGVSRVTLHRIEAGNPSVTIGAYVNVAAALGLHLVVPVLDAPAAEPATVTVGDYPGLRTLAWQADAGTTITETEALNLYERGWRHLDQETLTDHEKAFIQHLADAYSNGRLLV